MLPHDDPSWPYYGDTVLELFDESPLRIDLRFPVPPAARESLLRGGLAGAFAVITAADPRGQVMTSDANRWYHEELRSLLADRGLAVVPAAGVSLDGEHREDGFAVSIDQAGAVEIARRFGQSALFWFDGSDFWLVPVLVHEVPTRLPLDPPPSDATG